MVGCAVTFGRYARRAWGARGGVPVNLTNQQKLIYGVGAAIIIVLLIIFLTN